MALDTIAGTTVHYHMQPHCEPVRKAPPTLNHLESRTLVSLGVKDSRGYESKHPSLRFCLPKELFLNAIGPISSIAMCAFG